MQKYPWSAKQLRRLGESIRDDQPVRPNTPDYGEVMAYFNDYAEGIRQEINSLDWSSLLQGRPFEVTARPKTVDTLQQKLLRDRNTPLPNIQDIAGIRFEAEMTLAEQDAVANALAGKFDIADDVCLRDMRDDPHSGYRAVHLWLRNPARAEIQIRTHLQGKWANMYEAAADVLGRDIRYGVTPEHPVERKLVEFLHMISKAIARHEMTQTRFIYRDFQMYPRPQLTKRYARMRKSDVRRMNHINRRYVYHEHMRVQLKATEEQIASDCDALKGQFESLLARKAERAWQDS